MPAGALPRNAMFVLAALPFALIADAKYIGLGTNTNDAAMPDGKPQFIDKMNDLFVATDQPVRLEAPFLSREFDKVDVARKAIELLGSDIDRTWSCWGG